MAAPESLAVQVCYALPEAAFLRALNLPPGSTVQQAIEHSGLLLQHPEIDLAVNMVGIYGKKKTLDTVLRAQDRVEVYRPLQADPKEARRRRAGGKGAKS
ncbi:RnfH family protein [Janthinobacterium sp. PC23-8]|uniref:RnfH family protein n=1 Tax=Janthinobacterium sp. PC23-8 TaxID=2012679 RepID=UPI000B96327B|nr:RnfH family protein [Janthinobacterium sp. PC23-8]OYO29200.1 RnfH family protein [Janthinobacterium sp. PC23-8]